MPVLLIF